MALVDLHALEQREPGRLGQLEVQHDAVEAGLVEPLQRLLARRDALDVHVLAADQRGDAVALGVVVVDHEHGAYPLAAEL